MVRSVGAGAAVGVFVGCTWASQACIPHAVKSALARAGRQKQTTAHRLQRYRAVFDRLAGQRITREDLAILLYEEYRKGYKAHQDAVRRGGREAA